MPILDVIWRFWYVAVNKHSSYKRISSGSCFVCKSNLVFSGWIHQQFPGKENSIRYGYLLENHPRKELQQSHQRLNFDSLPNHTNVMLVVRWFKVCKITEELIARYTFSPCQFNMGFAGGLGEFHVIAVYIAYLLYAVFPLLNAAAFINFPTLRYGIH